MITNTDKKPTGWDWSAVAALTASTAAWVATQMATTNGGPLPPTIFALAAAVWYLLLPRVAPDRHNSPIWWAGAFTSPAVQGLAVLWIGIELSGPVIILLAGLATTPLSAAAWVAGRAQADTTRAEEER